MSKPLPKTITEASNYKSYSVFNYGKHCIYSKYKLFREDIDISIYLNCNINEKGTLRFKGFQATVFIMSVKMVESFSLNKMDFVLFPLDRK